VLATPGFVYPPKAQGAPVSPGTTLIERLFEGGSERPSALLVMVKMSPGFDADAGDWEFLRVSPTGILEERGKIPSCARCHAEAPHAGVFGRPRAD